MSPAAQPAPLSSQIVIRFPDQTLKGHLLQQGWEEGLDEVESVHLDSLSMRPLDTDEVREVPLAEAKAVFFVRDFAGVTDRADLRFHDTVTPPQYLWVRLVFEDGEVLEGMTRNDCTYLLQPGFWVTPTDPTANNWLVYVLKSKLKHFEVLGLRQRMHKRAPSNQISAFAS